MAVTLGEVLVRFGAETSGFNTGVAGMAARLDSFAAKAVATGVVIGGAIAVGAIAIGVASTKMAGDFQQGINRLRTGAGDAQDSFASLSAGILKVSVATGELTGPLNSAMYLIASNGQRGAQAFATLTAAAQGAQIEMASVADVAQILTTIQKNFGVSTFTATQYMDGLVSAVAHGKITLEDLSVSMSPILPMASELGLRFADVSAAMSDMTNRGIPASQAATALRFVFQSMILPTAAASKAMDKFGLDSTVVAATMKKSLPDAFQMYIDAALKAGPEGSKPFIDALSEMMGGGQRAAKALFALSQSMGDWRAIIAQVNASMHTGVSSVNGWAIAQSNFNIIAEKTKASLQAVGIQIGTVLLPLVGPLVSQVGTIAIEFGNWAVKSGALKDVIGFLGEKISGFIGFVQRLYQQLQANGAIASFKQILSDLGTIIMGVVNTALLLLGMFFGNTATKAGAVTDAATNIANAMATMAGIIRSITGILSAVAQAFSDTGIKGDLLRGMLLLIGAAFLAIKIGSAIQALDMMGQRFGILASASGGVYRALLTMIPAFWTWTASMYSSLPAMWATTVSLFGLDIALGPLILIILAVIVVILAVILVIRNWGAIMTWCGNVMSAVGTFMHGVLTAIGGWFGNVFSAIGTFVRDRLTDIKNFVGTIFSAIGTTIHDKLEAAHQIVTTVWNAIKGAFSTALNWIVNFVAGIFNTIGGWFTWLYNHNYYVKAFCDAIVIDFQALMKLPGLVGNIFSAIGTFIRDRLTWIKNIVGDACDWLGSRVRDAFTWIKNFVGGIMSAIGDFIHDRLTWIKNLFGGIFDWIGTHVHDRITETYNTIVSVLGMIWGTVQSKLTDVKNFFGRTFDLIGTLAHDKFGAIWNKIWGVISAWPGQLFNFGVNLIHMLLSGITSMFGAIGNVVSQIGGFFHKILGFHSPPQEGPAHDSDTWMPNMINMFIKGINSKAPQFQASLNQLVKMPTGLIATQQGIGATPAQNQQPTNIILQVNGQDLARAISQGQVNLIRLQTGKY